MKKSIKTDHLPKRAGVYFFKDDWGKIIYIGKSVDIKSRVKSYFQAKDLWPTAQKMIIKTRSVSYKSTQSEFEALLLESQLINKYQPEYNIKSKDDKSFIKIAFTKEAYPRIYTTKEKEKDGVFYFGPFKSAKEIKKILKRLRQSFAFRSCKTLPKKPCLYYHLNLCPAPCLGINKAEYKKTINRLKNIFKGKLSFLRKELRQEMELAAKQLDFEKAAGLKKQLETINHIAIYWRGLSNEELDFSIGKDGENEILKTAFKLISNLKSLKRIEAYDISNLSGGQAAGSMVVFQNLLPAKDQYRRFKIRLERISDTEMIYEVFKRRLRHHDWLNPNLILVDRGKGQVEAAFKALSEQTPHQKIAVVGLEKKQETIVVPIIERGKIVSWNKHLLKSSNSLLKLLQHLRDESHRFAKKYHLWLRRQALNSKNKG